MITEARAIVPAPSFVIVDHSAKPVPNLAAIAHALARQVNEHAGDWRPRSWGFRASVIALPMGTTMMPPGAVVVGLFDTPDQPGALGYHDKTPAGLPLIKVFPLLDAQTGDSVSSTISHEILEALGDPDGNTCAQSPVDGKIWATELCDACETETYLIDGIEVSDFCLPAYFSPPSDRSHARYDYLGRVTAPFQILPGGYGQYLTSHGWHSVEVPRGHAAMRIALGRPTPSQRRATFAIAHHERGYARRRHAPVAL